MLFKKIILIIFISFIYTQGIYVNRDAPTVYSLNLQVNSYNEYNTGISHYGLGVSSIMKGKHEILINLHNKSTETFI